MGNDVQQSLTITSNLKDFIISNFLFGEDPGLTVDTAFLEDGIIDSMGFLELIGYLEATYGIQIEDDELIPENMNSLANVTAFIDRKLGSIAEQSTDSAP